MKFYEALKECMENGKRIRNSKWNGKEAYVYYVHPSTIIAKNWVNRSDAGAITEKEMDQGFVEILGHLDMMTNDGKRLTGWLISQYDVVSDEWEVIG